jgi:uncharacterized protein (DUF488 family)
MTRATVLTVGHSTHSIEEFMELLVAHGVTAIADVRSAPYSRFNPHFNREPLQQALKDRGIAYVFLGRELGARSDDRSCYEDGRVQYRRLARTPLFQSGLDRVLQGAESYRLALLCAEKEPLECHRTFLVGRELETRGTSVAHIHADGHLETQADALTRLLGVLRMPQADLFKGRQELIEEACARQEARIAYVAPTGRPADERGAG